MTQKTIKLINGTEKLFKISNKRKVTGVSSKNKSGKTFTNIPDFEATKLNFQNLIESLPAQPGILILTGHYKNHQKTLEIIKSNESIRSAFSGSIANNRFQSLINYLKTDLYCHLQIQLAQAS